MKAFRPTLLGIAALVTLALNAWLARYDHPMGDDWSYAYQGMTKPLGPWLLGEYLHWNGRFFSNLLVGRGPLVLGLDHLWMYRLLPPVWMAFTVLAAFALVRALTHRTFTIRERILGALLFAALQLHAMPDPQEGFHWYTGAVTYQLGTILLLFHLACHADLLQGRHVHGRRALAIVGAVLAALVVGSSEVHMVVLLAIHAVLVVVRQRRGVHLTTVERATIGVLVGAAALMVLAPGNAVRAANFPERHRLVHSVWMSLLQTGRFGFTWALDPALLALSVLYLPVAARTSAHLGIVRSTGSNAPWWALGALFAVIFLCVFPAYWSTGILGQHRTVNVAHAMFLLLWALNLHLWCARARPLVDRLRPGTASAIAILAALSLTLGRNSANAWSDLYSGRAARFDAQLWERYAILNAARDTPTDPIHVPVIHDPPRSLYLLELRPEGTDWVNVAYARYFGLEGRQVMPDPASTRSQLR